MTSSPGNTQHLDFKRRLVAILFADIAGYTAMMQKDEREALNKLNTYQTCLKKQVGAYDGEIVKNYGDGSIVLFHSATAAVRCAKELQLELKKAQQVPLRIGLHLGDVLFKEGDVYGDAVNIASRIESMGVAGNVLLSKSLHQKVKNQTDLLFKSLGTYHFKNVDEPLEVWAMSNPGIVVPHRDRMQVKFEKRLKLSSRKFMITIALSLLLALFALYLFKGLINSNRSDDADALNNKKAIAVIPFRNLSIQGRNFDWFSDGISSELVNELTKIKTLAVKAFSATIPYKNTNENPVDVARALNVEFLIDGTTSVYKNGDSLRLSISLLDKDAQIIWNGTYNQEINEAPILQQKIAQAIALNLKISLTRQEEKALNELDTENGESFNMFLQAKAENRKFTAEGFLNTEKYLRKALQLDPRYSQAHALMAWNYYLMGAPSILGTFSNETIDSLMNYHIQEAINLNPNGSDNYLIRGAYHLYRKGQLRDAKRDVDLALTLNSWPERPTNYCICIVVSTYIALGEYVKAEELARIAREVDPHNVFIWFDQALLYMKKGDYAKAQALFEETVRLRDSPFFNYWTGWSYYHNQQYEVALNYFDKAYNQGSKPIANSVAYLSNTYYKLGNLDRSNQYLEELRSRQQYGEPNLNLRLAIIYAARGDKSIMMDWLERALEERDVGIAYSMNVDEIFVPYYDENRFIEIRKALQYY